MKSPFPSYCLLIVILFALIPHQSNATVIVKRSLNEVFNGSELVFQGRVISKVTRPSPESGNPFTYFTFEIIDIIKGSYGDPSIEIGFMGGQQGGLHLDIADMRMPEIGEEGIYFVETLDEQQVHPLFGWYQGHYLVIINSQTEQELVVPVREEIEAVKSRGLMIQQGVPLERFKQNIRDAMGGTQ